MGSAPQSLDRVHGPNSTTLRFLTSSRNPELNGSLLPDLPEYRVPPRRHVTFSIVASPNINSREGSDDCLLCTAVNTHLDQTEIMSTY
ncbi:hypothetical protein Q1695_005609 [Nippostrongylus brasiliensis]|nr:hypothetical protein Q1695_005609 [Nippostrongylus brasiliensis]